MLCAAAMFCSCADENQAARTPVASVNVSSTNLEINQSMEVTFTGVADQVVVFTGDHLHDYALRDSSNTGFVVNKNLFTYSYSVPGTFHVVCLASTYDTYMGRGQQFAKTEFDVKVTDDVTTIDKLYSTITPNVFYATLVNDKDWVLNFPTKQMYNGKEISLNASKQRLTFDIASDSSKIAIDGEAYKANNYYDLTMTHNILVTANSGATHDYRLYTLIYPEFASIKMNGVAATLSRDAYFQDMQTYTFSLPVGTDVSHAIPEFTVDPDVKLYANGAEVAPGSAIDLTRTDVDYTLKRVSAENASVTAVSRIDFVVKYI